MRLMKLALAGAMALALASPVLAADDSVTAKNAAAATITFCSLDIGAGVMASCTVPVTTAGVKMTPAKDSSVDGLEGVLGTAADSASTSGASTVAAYLRAIRDAAYDTTPSAVGGGVANGAANTDKALTTGGTCQTSAPAAESAGDKVQELYDCLGKGVNLPYALPASLVSGLTAAMTGTTSTAVTGMGAPGSGLTNYITTLACGNSHATVGTFVELQDGSGGTTFFTIPAAAVYGGAVLSFPAPLKQPTANTALFVKDTTTGANVICSAAGFKAP